MENSDQGLIKEYLNGDEAAFKALLDKYLRSVYNFVYRMNHNKEDAEDITQETFFKAWKNLKRYRDTENFKTWLFTIAKNTAIDLLRKKRSFVFSDFADENDGNIVEDNLTDPSPLPNEIFRQTEEKKRIDELLDNLPPAYKQVVLLRYENDFTFDEIGKILDKPLDTVKSQHRRALISLKKILLNAPK